MSSPATMANFHLTISLPDPSSSRLHRYGFTTQTFTGTLHSGEIFVVPQFKLPIATNVTVVRVGLTKTEVAENADQSGREAARAWIHAEFLRQL